MPRSSDDALNRVLAFAHNMNRDNEVPPIERIAGLFPRGYVSLFASQAGTGKTWFMQYIACRLSCGGNILNGLVPKSKPYTTVILAGETGKMLLDLRMKATCWSYNPKRIIIYDALELQREEVPMMLNTQEGRMSLITILNHHQPDVMYFDTLISFHTVDESKQGEMTNIYTFLLKVAKTFNCAIVLNHHTRKRSTRNPSAALTQDDIIGSNVGVRLSSCAYIAEQIQANVGDDSQGMPEVAVHNVKSWDKRIPDFSYKFITDESTGLIDFAIDWHQTTMENEDWSIRERVDKYIASMNAGDMIQIDALAGALVISQDKARRYLDDAVKKGRLERVKFMNVYVWKVIA